MKILFPLILFLLSQNLFPQSKFSDTTRRVPFDTNKIKEQTRLTSTSDVFSYDSLYIWSDERNLSEIMDERPGYFVFDFGLGQRNDINYNGRYSRETGIFRDGIQINDNFFQSYDMQNISVNEIDKIEEVSDVSSFFYGINSFSKSINVITKDIFQPKPFSQLRFSQDRFGALFADVIFSQPFSRKGNVQLGITNQSGDGRYENSAYNIWRGRGRINLFFSPKINAKLNFYLDNYDRDLNDGLVYSSNENNLTDPNNAVVVTPDVNENLENYFYDITLTGRFFRNKNSLTKLLLYSNNSLRHLYNPDTSLSPENYPAGFTHSVLYGIDASQNFVINHGRDFYSDILLGGNLYFNSFSGNLFNAFRDNQNSLRFKYDLFYKGIFISGLLRNDYIYDKNYLNAGIETKIEIINERDLEFELNAGANQTKYILYNSSFASVYKVNAVEDLYAKFYEAGGKLRYKDISISGEFYETNYGGVYGTHYGINSNISFISKYADLTFTYNYSNELMFPSNYVKSDLAYKNILFRGKLKLKTGIELKYYNIKNIITNQYQTWYGWEYTNNPFPQQNQFIADFYVGARIGRANINLTVANIFNSLVYNAYLFPLDDRGGFLNCISRFTIVWDFIN